MSWEHELFALFDDLEGQAAAAWEVDREAELADRARTEYAAVTLVSRLMASRGQSVTIDLPHVGRLAGRRSALDPQGTRGGAGPLGRASGYGRG